MMEGLSNTCETLESIPIVAMKKEGVGGEGKGEDRSEEDCLMCLIASICPLVSHGGGTTLGNMSVV